MIPTAIEVFCRDKIIDVMSLVWLLRLPIRESLHRRGRFGDAVESAYVDRLLVGTALPFLCAVREDYWM